MTVETIDVFSPVELYLLLSPIEAQHLFGVPDKLTFLLKEKMFLLKGLTGSRVKGF